MLNIKGNLFVFWLLLLTSFNLNSQSIEDLYGVEFKSYDKNGIDFSFFKLIDASSLMFFEGRTIDGNDVSTDDFYLKKRKVRIDESNILLFDFPQLNKPNSKFSIISNWKDSIVLRKENLILKLPDSYSKSGKGDQIYRTTSFYKDHLGAKSSNCITKVELFTEINRDSLIRVLKFKEFMNLIPYLTNCANGFKFDLSKYRAKGFLINIPLDLDEQSFGFGDNSFLIRFDSGQGDGKYFTTVQIDYDFQDVLQNSLETKSAELNGDTKILLVNDQKVYLSKNWQGKFSGHVFYGNNLVISYYTKSMDEINRLQKCITNLILEE